MAISINMDAPDFQVGTRVFNETRGVGTVIERCYPTRPVEEGVNHHYTTFNMEEPYPQVRVMFDSLTNGHRKVRYHGNELAEKLRLATDSDIPEPEVEEEEEEDDEEFSNDDTLEAISEKIDRIYTILNNKISSILTSVNSLNKALL